MQTPRLFTLLPEYINTPDGMEIDRHGNLILSCPNYAEPEITSGLVVKISPDKKITKWFDVPVEPTTGVARNMGICFDDDWNLYLCDNQGWSGEERLQFKGRLLKVKADDDGHIGQCTVVARGMEHPNGVKWRGGYVYVTQSLLSKVKLPGGEMVSCVYRFRADDEDIEVTNTLADKNIIATFITHNLGCPYGADGLDFGPDGALYVGNFGDGSVNRILFDGDGNVLENHVVAQNPAQLTSTDGFCFDEKGNLYIADFSANAICVMRPDFSLERIAQSPDCDGLDGSLDQPGEPRVYRGKIVASCFDLVTDPGKVNTAHEMPATMSELDLVP